jgi:hypothetical protein
MITKIDEPSNNDNQNQWPSDYNDKIQTPSDCQLWFQLMSIDHAHFQAPPKNHQMVTKIFSVVQWWLIFQGTWNYINF